MKPKFYISWAGLNLRKLPMNKVSDGKRDKHLSKDNWTTWNECQFEEEKRCFIYIFVKNSLYGFHLLIGLSPPDGFNCVLAAINFFFHAKEMVTVGVYEALRERKRMFQRDWRHNEHQRIQSYSLRSNNRKNITMILTSLWNNHKFNRRFSHRNDRIAHY